jgi:hypothetical protein
MLQQHLRSIRDGRLSAFASDGAAEITIFILSLDTPHPLFVVRFDAAFWLLAHAHPQDMHYQAVSLPDMIVAVQSRFPAFMSIHQLMLVLCTHFVMPAAADLCFRFGQTLGKPCLLHLLFCLRYYSTSLESPVGPLKRERALLWLPRA